MVVTVKLLLLLVINVIIVSVLEQKEEKERWQLSAAMVVTVTLLLLLVIIVIVVSGGKKVSFAVNVYSKVQVRQKKYAVIYVELHTAKRQVQQFFVLYELLNLRNNVKHKTRKSTN